MRSSTFSSEFYERQSEVFIDLERKTYEESTDTEIRERSHLSDDLFFACFQFGFTIDNQDEVIHRFAVFIDVGHLARFHVVLVELEFFVKIDIQQSTENVRRDEFATERIDACEERRIQPVNEQREYSLVERN